MSGVRIEYGDYAVGARENFDAYASNTADMFIDANQVLEDIKFPKCRDASEDYSVALDGDVLPFPSNPFGANLGWWSGLVSNENGEFSQPLTLTLSSDKAYTSPGLTFVFDTVGNVYATEMTVVWLGEGGMFLKGATFYPNSPTYFCESKVEFYKTIEVSIYKINMPNTRLKLYSVQFGRGTTFSGKELKSAKVKQTLNPISSEIAINTTDFVIDDKRATDHTFQARQTIKTYFNDNLISVSFVKKAKRKSKTVWDVQTEDYIGIMDGVDFVGGVYSEDDIFKMSAKALLEKIFITAKVPFEPKDLEVFGDTYVYGYIPYTTCRVALMQVLFAIQAVADTSCSDVVRVYPLTDGDTKGIDKKQVMQGQNLDEGTRVTEVSVTEHSFIKTDEEVVVYKGSESGATTKTTVIFSEPLYDLSIKYGGIYESGANYAIISATDLCELVGKKYKHARFVKSIKNGQVLSTDTDNVVSVTNATLVTKSNIDNVLDKCYKWLVRTDKLTTRIAERRHNDGSTDTPVMLGDKINVPTEFGEFEGRVVKTQFGLNGGMLIKDVEVV